MRIYPPRHEKQPAPTEPRDGACWADFVAFAVVVWVVLGIAAIATALGDIGRRLDAIEAAMPATTPRR